MEYLEFSEDFERFHEAFTLPEGSPQWRRVGKKGREIRPDYFYTRWIHGQDTGIVREKVIDATVWAIARAERQKLLSKWTKAMIAERIEAIQNVIQNLDNNQERLEELYNEQKVEVLNS